MTLRDCGQSPCDCCTLPCMEHPAGPFPTAIEAESAQWRLLDSRSMAACIRTASVHSPPSPPIEMGGTISPPISFMHRSLDPNSFIVFLPPCLSFPAFVLFPLSFLASSTFPHVLHFALPHFFHYSARVGGGGKEGGNESNGGPKMKDSPSLSSWRHRNESFYEISKTGTQSLSVLSEGDSPPGATLLVAP